MCCPQNKAMRDYQESVTTGQTHRQTDTGQSDPYVPLCFAGDTIKHRADTATSLVETIVRGTIMFKARQ